MVKSSLVLSAFFVAPVFGAGALACTKKKADASPKTCPPPLVVVAKVATRDVNVEVHAPVELRPRAQAEVGAKTLGYLDAVLVERCDEVKRGQRLVRPSDLPDQLAAARGTFAQAQASASLAKRNLDRVSGLAPKGVVSQQELQQAQAAVATAEAQESAAKTQDAPHATRIGEIRITSPLALARVSSEPRSSRGASKTSPGRTWSRPSVRPSSTRWSPTMASRRGAAR